MNDLKSEILKSPEAKRIIRFVTEGFYDDSYTGLWLYEVIGRELDDMKEWADGLTYEAFPQSAEWGLEYLEYAYGLPNGDDLSIEIRRHRLLSKMLERTPLNPYRIELVVKTLTNTDAEVFESVAPYTFAVALYPDAEKRINYRELLKAVRKMKPSHLSLYFIDKPPPVCLTNSSGFLFDRFCARLFISSGSLLRAGITSASFKAVINGLLIWKVYLDGAYLLNGGWLLNQAVDYKPQERVRAASIGYGAGGRPNVIGYNFNALNICGVFSYLEKKPTYIDGENALDGSWVLAGGFTGISAASFDVYAAIELMEAVSAAISIAGCAPFINGGGLLFDMFGVRISVNNGVGVSCGISACIKIKQKQLARLSAFKAGCFLVVNEGGYKARVFEAGLDVYNGNAVDMNNGVCFLFNAVNKYSLCAELTKDSMYTLSGSVFLNGERRLNADTIKEMI